MPAFVADPFVERRLLAERRAAGSDKYDEVWDGVYMVMPLPNNEHQELVGRINNYLFVAVEEAGLGRVFPGVNVSDRRENWEHNYREPDVAVFLNDSPAENCGTHWLGGPNLAVEVVSRHDRSREKLDFYARVGVEELLVIDREPWRLELYRLREGRLEEAGVSTVDNPQPLKTHTTPIAWRLLTAQPRPQVELTHDDGRRWVV
ncbi:MAG: Uma2 family endonuclease [Planctomycetes bacterium]|nr:Uma2 family endonuclease [Planctomycetota bacterium]